MPTPMRPAKLPETADDALAVDANTTLDIFIGPHQSITELADTVDDVQAKTIDIVNKQDGTHLEVILLEELSPDDPGKYVVDNFVTVDGIGPEIARLLLAGGIRTFKQLAETPVERIRAILEAAGTRYRIHDAEDLNKQADQLQTQAQRRTMPMA